MVYISSSFKDTAVPNSIALNHTLPGTGFELEPERTHLVLNPVCGQQNALQRTAGKCPRLITTTAPL